MTENLGDREGERPGETEQGPRGTHWDRDSAYQRGRCAQIHSEVGRRQAGGKGGDGGQGQRQQDKEGRRERGRERQGHVVPRGGKERQTQKPGCSRKAGSNRLGGQQIPDGPHLGGCGHPVAPQGPEGIVGLARRGWESGAQDRESFTKPGWVRPSRQPSRVAGQSCGRSPARGKQGAEGVESGRFGRWGPSSKVTQHLYCEAAAPQRGVSPCLESVTNTETRGTVSPPRVFPGVSQQVLGAGLGWWRERGLTWSVPTSQ